MINDYDDVVDDDDDNGNDDEHKDDNAGPNIDSVCTRSAMLSFTAAPRSSICLPLFPAVVLWPLLDHQVMVIMITW